MVNDRKDRQLGIRYRLEHLRPMPGPGPANGCVPVEYGMPIV